MMSFYQAYQAYERRHILGVFDQGSRKKWRAAVYSFTAIMSRLGDVLISAGLGLKRRYTVSRTTSLSSLSGGRS